MREGDYLAGLVLAALAMLAVAGGLAPAALAEVPAAGMVQADRVLVLKGERRLYLLRGASILRSYRIALGRKPQGAKVAQGDGRTPEGRYVLDWRNADSRFYRSIHVSYPNADDRARSHRLGVPPGGDIMIHGLPNGSGTLGGAHARWDWTEGCIAVSNAEMDEIWGLVGDGTVIEIRP